jgi:hypothetical protein
VEACVATADRKFFYEGECLAACPPTFFGGPSKQGQCMRAKECPLGYYGHEGTHMCVKKDACVQDPKIKGFVYEPHKQCIPDCSKTLNPAQPFSHEGVCLAKCPKDSFGPPSGKGACVAVCPAILESYFGEASTALCKTKAQCNFMNSYVYQKLCIKDCSQTKDPARRYSYAGTCVDKCPNVGSNTVYGHNGQGECIPNCPTNFYAHNEENIGNFESVQK